jgi:hypothetical protein
MSVSFPDIARFELKVGQTRCAADALVGLLGSDRAEFVGDRRVQGDPRRPGGLPHYECNPMLSEENQLKSMGLFGWFLFGQIVHQVFHHLRRCFGELAGP